MRSAADLSVLIRAEHSSFSDALIDQIRSHNEQLIRAIQREAIAACVEAAKGVLIGRTLSLQGLTPMQVVEEVERTIAKVGA